MNLRTYQRALKGYPDPLKDPLAIWMLTAGCGFLAPFYIALVVAIYQGTSKPGAPILFLFLTAVLYWPLVRGVAKDLDWHYGLTPTGQFRATQEFRADPDIYPTRIRPRGRVQGLLNDRWYENRGQDMEGYI